ncbi:MAG TPA: hypothetical protein VJR89_37690, partial [Polyangiales bacterium]|nr:hypothetical protein [Polyangiales bacterium]
GDVDPELVSQLGWLSDGTPLGALSLLRLLLEQGHLRQHERRWHFDAGWRSMELPRSSQELIRLRLAALPAEHSRALQAAAILGAPIRSATLIAAQCGSGATIGAALQAAREAGLVQCNQDGSYDFVHDCVRDALLRDVSNAEQRLLHGELARALYASGSAAGDGLYLVARLYAASNLRGHPVPAFAVLRRAARQAIDACDDRLALSFLQPAHAAAKLAGIALDRDFYVDLAETSLRTGDVHAGLQYFEAALGRSRSGGERAHVFGRMAWIHHFESDAAACWEALSAALAECSSSASELETFGWLNIACFRAALEDGQIRRLAASAARLASIVTRLPDSRVRVNVELILAFAQCWVGASAGAWLTLARAEKLAARLGDPIARTSCLAFRHVLCGWQDQLVEAERYALLCHESSQWMEQLEYLHLCVGVCSSENARGRPEQALAWIERALARVRYEGRAPAILTVLESAGYATLLTLGRSAQAHAFKERWNHVERAALRPGSYLYLLQFQSRAQELIARGRFDQEFEALIDEFEAWVRNPRHGHILVAAPFYAQVCQGRLQQCLEARGGAREALLPALSRASKHLEIVTRKRSGAACALVIKAACAWLRGSRKADTLLAESERLAQLHGYACVSCTVNRLRAHMLRDSGNLEAARDQARIAAMLAEQYGQVPILRAIRREFFADTS